MAALPWENPRNRSAQPRTMDQPAHTSESPLRPPRQRFSVIAVTAILILGALFAAYGVFDRRESLASGIAAAEQMSDQTALAAEGTLEASRQLLRAMAMLLDPPVQDARIDPAAVRETLLGLRAGAPHVMDLLVLSADGEITDWTGSGPPPMVSDRDYYQVHRQPGSALYVGPPLLSKVHQGRWFFPISEAMRNDRGELQRVLVVIVDVAVLRERLAMRHFRSGNTQALMTTDGRIYTRTPDHARHVGRTVLRPEELGRLSPERPYALIISPSQLDSEERIIAFRHLGSYPMVAVATVSVPELLTAWRTRLAIVVALWFAISAGIVVLARRATAIGNKQVEYATMDSLTGVHNRRSIMAWAHDLGRSREPSGQLSLLMIDIDHFKQINDRFGHLAGDHVIRKVSHLLRDEVRGSDIVGRYGGEEFLVLMPETGASGATHVAEKLRESISQQVKDPAPVTVSIGVATMDASEADLEAALASADAALYAAKQAGRNCVRVAPATQRA